jgi:ABC-type protease/lipase transport system fused ATPase/permease subunit
VRIIAIVGNTGADKTSLALHLAACIVQVIGAMRPTTGGCGHSLGISS